MICQTILFLHRSRVWSLESLGADKGHKKEVLVQSTVGRSLSGAADDAHSSEDCWEIHLDTSRALQEGASWPSLGNGEKTGVQRGEKLSRASRLNPGEETNRSRTQFRMSRNVLCTFLSLLTLSGLTGAHWDIANHTQYLHGISTNYWWQFMNTTAHINNETNCYVCAHMPLSTHSSGLWPYSHRERDSLFACLSNTPRSKTYLEHCQLFNSPEPEWKGWFASSREGELLWYDRRASLTPSIWPAAGHYAA